MNPPDGSRSANGVIPSLGLGTWKTKGDRCVDAVRRALDLGYRHIDTAQLYGNEEAVGRAIGRSDVPRDQVFLATKVAPQNCAPGRLVDTTHDSLTRLDTPYVDLLYVHWPSDSYDPTSTLRAMLELVTEGLIRHIGVSNFTLDLLDEALEATERPILANQIELHPLLQQASLVEGCRDRGVGIVAYSPFRHGTILERKDLGRIARRHRATPAQVILSWLIREKNVVAIPKSTSEQHLRDNYEALDLQLQPRDVRLLDDMDEGDRFLDPPFAPW